MDNDGVPTVVLASRSAPRARMLTNAGVRFTVDAASLDEAAIRNSVRATGADAAEVAEILAATKAQQVSRSYGDGLVIGADQMLVCDGEWFDKPAGPRDARNHLIKLCGKTHELVSACCVAQGGAVLWHHIERARITLRPFSEGFIDDYIDKMGDTIMATVGGYELEGLGAQLFSRIEGDYFTILGMPLLPLLGFLRAHGVVSE